MVLSTCFLKSIYFNLKFFYSPRQSLNGAEEHRGQTFIAHAHQFLRLVVHGGPLGVKAGLRRSVVLLQSRLGHLGNQARSNFIIQSLQVEGRVAAVAQTQTV